MSFINNNWWLVPLIITIFSGILCPAMGTVLITHKRLLQVNLISHSVLPGLALALALGIHPSIGGVISGLLGSVIAESLTNRKRENYEATYFKKQEFVGLIECNFPYTGLQDIRWRIQVLFLHNVDGWPLRYYHIFSL